MEGHQSINFGQVHGYSPKITGILWGEIATEAGIFRDVKLWPGGGRLWDWNETGTDHSPGIQPEDVQELLDNGARLIVLGQGQQEQLEVMQETIDAIRAYGADVEMLATREAVERYNELAKTGEPVGALIHSTC